MANAVIHFTRPGKGESLYTERLVDDNGARIVTRSEIRREDAIQWMRESWQPAGLLNESQVIAVVRKHHFYQEWFGIMPLFDANGKLLGTYCDMLAPLEKRGDEYYLRDLSLDLWIAPDGACKELDWDEFNAASSQNLLTPFERERAVATMRGLIEETRQGRFPKQYIQP